MENNETLVLETEKKDSRLKRLWNYFTTYEKWWFFGIMGLAVLVTILFPSSVEDLEINPWLIMSLYLLDILLSLMCELLISKQSKWNFIVSLGIEITEIVTLILLAERFATMTVTLFFWIPIDIISFVNWHKHKDDEKQDLTVVRELRGWQEVLVILGIVVWTFGVGYLLTVISPEYGLLETNSWQDNAVCYMDAACSVVGICNGLFILFRYKEQWVAWYLCAILETIMNIIMGQWVLLVLKLGYFTNTTYGYIKWSKYIKQHNSIAVKKVKHAKK